MMKTVLMLVIWVKAATATTQGTCHSTPQVTAQVGKNVTLQCCFDASLDLSIRTFDWKKDDKQVALGYRNGKVRPYLQDTQFRHRTALIQEDLSRGGMMMQIFSVQLSDNGNYSCNVPKVQGSEMLSQRVRLIVTNATEVRPNTTRSPEEDKTSKSDVKNTDVIAFVGLSLFVAGLVGLGLVVLVKWKNNQSCWRRLRQTPTEEDADIYQM